MKYCFLILLSWLLGFTSHLNAQKITLGKEDLKAVLCQQWGVDFAKMGEMKIKQIPGATDFDFRFKPDGTYEIIEEKGEIREGSWTFYPEGKYVELEINGTTTSRIASINASKLILVMTPEDNGPPGLPKLEVHFKPVR